MLRGAIVVQDQMQLELARKFLVESLKELQELLVPVPRVALADGRLDAAVSEGPFPPTLLARVKR
jgi:hypothetical protein